MEKAPERSSDIEVQQVSHGDVKPWLLLRHYAHRMCNVVYAFGAFRGTELVGVVTYGIPPSPHLCRGLCGPDFSDKVLELNRLCCESSKNLASTLVGRSLRMLPRPGIVVSFADTKQGHVGYVYQATNFIYTGLTDSDRPSPRVDRIVTDGRHGRNQGRIKGTGKIDHSVGIIVPRKPKHRYVFPCGNRRQRASILKLLRYSVFPYPKGESMRYDATAAVGSQMRLI